MSDFDYSFLLEVLIGGLLSGVMYSLVAIGFVLIYKTSGVLNFAQGSMVLFAALTFVGILEHGVPFFVSLAIALVIMAALGVTVERTVLRPLVNKSPIILFMATLGLAYILEGAAQLIWGTQVHGLNLGFDDTPLQVGDVLISSFDLFRAPTGNRPTGIFLFEPIIGNGHHWEFGGGFNGHWDFWATEDECTYASFYVDAIVTHLFIATQKRTFDLRGKPFSRYMLTERMDYAYTNTFASNSLNYQGFTQSRPGPNGQFQDEYMPVANITTITVDVGVDVQAELTAFFTVVHNAWSFDVGYNFWARTCDDISLKPNKNPPLPQSFSLKGDAFVFGLVQGDPNNTALELGASESNATIHAGTNLSPSGNTSFNAGATNPNIDNPVPAQTPTTPLVNGVNGLQINTSVDPIYINIPKI